MLIKYDGMICSKSFWRTCLNSYPFAYISLKKNAKYALSEIILPREVNLNTGSMIFLLFKSQEI